MRLHGWLASISGLLLAVSLASTARAAEFVRDGVVVLDAAQITPTSDGFVPGTSWQGFLVFPAPITVNAGDTLKGTISFGSGLLRIRDDGNGFFQVGQVKGFEQLIANATDGGALIVSQTDCATHFTDVRGPALETGDVRVGGINHNGLFIQVVLDFVTPGQEFFASGGTYRLGFVSGGRPFTFDRVSLRVLSQEIGIESRPVGDVAYRGCITGETDSGPGGTDACAQIASATAGGDNSGLNNLRAVAESPDGKSLYAVSGFDDAIARFDRDVTSGALTYQGCITGETESGPAGTNACTLLLSATSNGTNSGLDTLQSVVVSSDGKSVYTASIGDDAVARFARDAATGALTFQDCITGEEVTNTTTCTSINSVTANGADSGLDGLRALALTADGKSLYGVASEDDAISRFDRDPATGALTYQGCISGETETGPTASGACTLIGSASSLGANSGLDSLFSLAVSPDGKSVYTVSLFDDAIARFDRDPATGALTYQGCISGETESGPTGSNACVLIGSAAANGTNSGLDELFAVAVSPDGKSVYPVSEQDDAVARFDRDTTTGALSYQGCITGETQSGMTGSNACVEIDSATSGGTNSGLDKLRSVGVSPDDVSVYVASPADDTVARFDRDPATGALTYQGCLTGEKETGPTGTGACGQIGSAASNGTNSGLDNPQWFVVSADGLSLYTASGNDAAVARFDREPEPPPTTTTTSTTTTTTTSTSTTEETTSTTTSTTTEETTSTTTSTTTEGTTSTTASTTTAPTSTTIQQTTTTTSVTTSTTTSNTTTTTTGSTSTTSTTQVTTTTTSTAPTLTTTSSTTTTREPTSTTTTTLPGGCDSVPGLAGIECQLNGLLDVLEATSDEDLGGEKAEFEHRMNKALRLIRRAERAKGRLATANPRKVRVLLKTFIGILERRVERGKIAAPLADDLSQIAETIRADLLPFTRR